MTLILASQSPRRKEILSYFSIPFGVRASDFDEDSIPEKELVGDEGDQGLELLGENESGKETMNGHMEGMVSDIQGEALLKEADSTESPALEPEPPSSSADQTSVPAIEQPLIQTPAESSSSSEENPSLH